MNRTSCDGSRRLPSCRPPPERTARPVSISDLNSKE
jgi:hypothetical protein